MRGSIKGQTLHILNESGINCIGKSKFSAKDGARMALAAEGRSGTAAAIAEKTGIHSFGTRDTYLDKWQELGRFCKEEFRIKDLEKLTAEHVKEFLAYKIEMGVSYSHWSGNAAAFAKLENALNAYSERFDRGSSYDFRSAIKELRSEARLELPRFTGTRNYDKPERLIAAIKDSTHQLVAKIQHESGLRIAGATNITAGQLKGLSKDAVTGKAVGLIDYKGKGGKAGTVQVSAATYQELEKYIFGHGTLNVSADAYRSSLKVAAQVTGQSYNGSHGLRWNFAKERFSELQKSGIGYEKALGLVSESMGHNRIEISEHYLGLK